MILHVQNYSSVSTILSVSSTTWNTLHPYCFTLNFHRHLSHLPPILIFEDVLNIVGNVILALLLLRLHPILLASAHLTPGSKVLRRTSWPHHPLNRGTWWLLSTSPDTLLDKRSSPVLGSNYLTSVSSLATKTRVLNHSSCSSRTSYHWPRHWTPGS